MFNVSSEMEPTAVYNHIHLIATLAFCLTTLVGVPGNALVLWVTGVKMEQTVTTVWFGNLALADIMCCLFLPFLVVQSFSQDWLYGPVICKILPFILSLNMYTSVFTLVAISIDRWILVVHPVWARNHRRIKMAWMICLAIWMLSFMMCLPKAIYNTYYTFDDITIYNTYDTFDNFTIYNTYDTFDNFTIYNTYDAFDNFTIYNTYDAFDNITIYNTYDAFDNFTVCYSEPHIIEPFYLTCAMFGFLIPLIIICICYIHLAFTVQKIRFSEVGRKTIKMSISVIVVFFITWAPYHIIRVILLHTDNEVLDILYLLTQSLAMFNSCVNPILYVFMGRDMKQKLRQSIGEIIQNIFRENLLSPPGNEDQRTPEEEEEGLPI